MVSSARNKRRCLHLSSKSVSPTPTRILKTPAAWPSKPCTDGLAVKKQRQKSSQTCWRIWKETRPRRKRRRTRSNGLRVALKAQPNILAVALPKLAAPPITPDKAKTLGALASVAGPALPPHLDSIIPRLFDAIEEETNLQEEMSWTKRESFDDVSKFPAFNALRSIIAAAPEDCGDKLLSELSDALTELRKMSSLKKVDEEKEKAKARRRAVSSIALADFATTFSGYDNFVDAQVLVKTLIRAILGQA